MIIDLSSGCRNSAGVESQKHEIYVTAFGGHLLRDLICRSREAMVPCPLCSLFGVEDRFPQTIHDRDKFYIFDERSN